MPLTPSAIPDSAAGVADITTLLRRSSEGDRGAEAELIAVVYEDLRRCAQRECQRQGGSVTGQPTAVVHDLYIKLLRENPQAWPNRRYFFGAFARAVHDHLIDQIRRRARRGQHEEVSPQLAGREDLRNDEILALRDCLERLDALEPRAAEVFRSHFLLGLTIAEIAASLDIGHATVERDLRFARAWLKERLRP